MSSGNDQPPYPSGQYPPPQYQGQYPPPGPYSQGQYPGQYPAGQYPQPDEQQTSQYPSNPYPTAQPQQGPPGYSDGWQGQQPGQPAPGGYGPQYPYPGPPPKKKSKAGWWIAGGVGALVLVLVVVTVGVIALRHHKPTPGPPGPNNTTASSKVLWQAPFTAASVAGNPIVAGVWTSSKAVIRGGGDGLHAYDIKNGKELWSVPIPNSGVVCSMAPSTLQGVGALIYGAPGKFDAACDHLLAVDTNTGRQLWTADLTPVDTSNRSTGGDPNTSVSMATGAVVIQTSDVIRGYATSDGTKLWGLVIKPTPPATISDCQPQNSLAQGDRVLVVVSCSDSSGYITATNAQTGKEEWTHLLSATEGDELFTDPISVRPAVVETRVAGGDPRLLVLDDSTGRLSRTILPVTSGIELNFRSEGSRGSGAFRYPLAVQDGKLFAATVSEFGSKEGKLMSIDVGTGQPTWTTGGGAKSDLWVVSADSHSVLTFDRGSFGHLPGLVRFDVATGKRTQGVTFPKNLTIDSIGRLIYVQDDKLVLVASRPSSDNPPIEVVGKP
jgi:hypothetical protein